MERKLSYDIYAVAFILSLLTFLAGIYLGGIVNQSNFENINGEVSAVSQRVSSMQVLMLADSNSSSYCPLYLSELASIDAEVERLGYKLTYLEDTKQAYDPEVKRRYFALEAESYLLSKKARSACSDNSTLLINFYSNKACDICKKQGEQILSARDQLLAENRMIKLFSFDGDLGSPVADAFKVEYNVTIYPSVIINGKTYPGYHSAAEIIEIVRRG